MNKENNTSYHQLHGKIRQFLRNKGSVMSCYGWVLGIFCETGSVIVKKGQPRRIYGSKILYGNETIKSVVKVINSRLAPGKTKSVKETISKN